MTSPLCVATGGWCRRVFHYRPPTPMYRNSPPLCTIVLQIPSLMPLKMRKVQLGGSVGSLGHIGGAVHPVWDGRPGIFRYGLDEIVQAFVLADGDGEAQAQLAADGYHAMGVEAAVGAHRELPAGPSVAHPPHCFTQEVGGTASGVGPALAQPAHQHIAGSGGDSQQRVIAPLAGIAVVACPFLGQSVAELCPYPARAEATNWVSPPQRSRRDRLS